MHPNFRFFQSEYLLHNTTAIKHFLEKFLTILSELMKSRLVTCGDWMTLNQCSELNHGTLHNSPNRLSWRVFRPPRRLERFADIAFSNDWMIYLQKNMQIRKKFANSKELSVQMTFCFFVGSRNFCHWHNWTHWVATFLNHNSVSVTVTWFTSLVQEFVISFNRITKLFFSSLSFTSSPSAKEPFFWFFNRRRNLGILKQVKKCASWFFCHFCSPSRIWVFKNLCGCRSFCILEIFCDSLQPLRKTSTSLLNFSFFGFRFFCGLIANPISGSSQLMLLFQQICQ